MTISESELILNPDGSIYHLHLKPEDIAQTIITVGDPHRVKMVSRHFDAVDIVKQHREFVTHTGICNGRRITVLSTGIGTSNIDIVLNELDALVNIDFTTRQVKNKHTVLTLVRIGTSGALQPDIEVDSLLVSEAAIGFDNLPYYYEAANLLDPHFSQAFCKAMDWTTNKSQPYMVFADNELGDQFGGEKLLQGITATQTGFYGPQARKIRLGPSDADMLQKLTAFSYRGRTISNLEMETAGIYALARLLGHKAISLNAILANRANGVFSEDPNSTIDRLIQHVLTVLTK